MIPHAGDKLPASETLNTVDIDSLSSITEKNTNTFKTFLELVEFYIFITPNYIRNLLVINSKH